MGHREIVMQRSRRGQNPNARHYYPVLYGRRVGNPFARMRKFSGKTASTARQVPSKKGAGCALFEVLQVQHSRQVLANCLALRELERLACLGAAVLLAL